MSIDNLSAANAYRNQLKMMQNVLDAPEDTGKSASMNGEFSKLLKNAAEQSIQAQYNSEALQMNALTGKVDVANLVTAVANAEIALQTVVAVRDRVIGAYQDIIKMPI